MLPLRPAQCIRRSRKRKPKSPSLKTRQHNKACVSYAMCAAPHENLNYIASSLVPVPQRRGNPRIPKQWNPCQNRFSELHPAMESATRLPSRSEQLHSERASKVSYSCSRGSHTLPSASQTWQKHTKTLPPSLHCEFLSLISHQIPHTTCGLRPLSWSRITSNITLRALGIWTWLRKKQTFTFLGEKKISW